MRLSNKLLGQGYVKERLKSSLRKFYGRYEDLTKQYEVRMLHDILDDDHIQWHPPLIGHCTNFWPLLIWTLLPNLTFYLIVQGFHRTYATGAACQQRTLTPPDTWSCPTLGLACVLMSRPISPELVLSCFMVDMGISSNIMKSPSSKMLHDILGHDHIQWHPQLIRHFTNYRTVLYYRFWPYYQLLEVFREHCNECG